MTERSNAFRQYSFLVNAAGDAQTIHDIREQLARDRILRSKPEELRDLCIIILARIEYLDTLTANKLYVLQTIRG